MSEEEEHEYIVVKKPHKLSVVLCSVCVTAYTYWRNANTAIVVGKNLALLVYRLTWIKRSLVPVCSPKIVFCASVIVVLACLMNVMERWHLTPMWSF